MRLPGSYHHGNLRAALIAAAAAILEQQGVGALTLREAARRAGVSQAAPYRHFADKRDLLAAVAEQGFRLMTAAMRAAMTSQPASALARFQAQGQAYVAFAEANAAHFRLMFGPETADMTSHPGLRQAGDETFGLLLASVREAQAEGSVRSGDPLPLAMSAWAAVHGLASLLINRRLTAGGKPVGEFTQAVPLVLYLGLRPEPAGADPAPGQIEPIG